MHFSETKRGWNKDFKNLSLHIMQIFLILITTFISTSCDHWFFYHSMVFVNF